MTPLQHLKIHAHTVKHANSHLPRSHIRQLAEHAVTQEAQRLIGHGLPHHVVSKAHEGAIRHIRGKGFFDVLKKVAQKVAPVAKTLYNTFQPQIQAGLSSLADKGINSLIGSVPMLSPFAPALSNMANAGIGSLPQHMEGGIGGKLKSTKKKGSALNPMGGNIHAPKGSAQAKAKMAKVRAAKRN